MTASDHLPDNDSNVIVKLRWSDGSLGVYDCQPQHMGLPDYVQAHGKLLYAKLAGAATTSTLWRRADGTLASVEAGQILERLPLDHDLHSGDAHPSAALGRLQP